MYINLKRKGILFIQRLKMLYNQFRIPENITKLYSLYINTNYFHMKAAFGLLRIALSFEDEDLSSEDKKISSKVFFVKIKFCRSLP